MCVCVCVHVCVCVCVCVCVHVCVCVCECVVCCYLCSVCIRKSKHNVSVLYSEVQRISHLVHVSSNHAEDSVTTHRSQFGKRSLPVITVMVLDAQALALQVERQVHNVPQVVKPIDVGVLEGGLQVVLDALDDDVGVHCQDGDEGGVVITEQ